MMLDGMICVQQSHWWSGSVPSKFGWLQKIDKGINHKLVTKFRKKLFQHEIEQFIFRSIVLFILFGIRKNSLRRVIKQTVVITDPCHSYQIHTKF